MASSGLMLEGVSQGEPELHMKPVANGAARYDAITSGITAQYDIKTGLGDEAHSIIPGTPV